jgi:hypothetical protein
LGTSKKSYAWRKDPQSIAMTPRKHERQRLGSKACQGIAMA